ncbi:MAG: hypothetical protein RLZZ303_1213 [Candidatus Hydrogenedentota bacterium]
MNPFHSISVTLGLVIGLGVARILSAFVSVFRSRTQASIDWIPLVWAACIFLWQIQFWWAIIELPSHLSTWTLTEFFLLLSMTLLLYVSAALVLPATDIIHGRTLADTFQRDGKWALLFLSAYFGQAIIVNWYLFDAPPFEYPAALNILLVINPLVFLYASSRRIAIWLTLAYLGVALWAAWEISPHSYTAR